MACIAPEYAPISKYWPNNNQNADYKPNPTVSDAAVLKKHILYLGGGVNPEAWRGEKNYFLLPLHNPPTHPPQTCASSLADISPRRRKGQKWIASSTNNCCQIHPIPLPLCPIPYPLPYPTPLLPGPTVSGSRCQQHQQDWSVWASSSGQLRSKILQRLFLPYFDLCLFHLISLWLHYNL